MLSASLGAKSILRLLPFVDVTIPQGCDEPVVDATHAKKKQLSFADEHGIALVQRHVFDVSHPWKDASSSLHSRL
ncbi:hypothetical protein H257_06118 [Aphanomyces astaci]|uniref:Uncharacterized protein n=1 Tax=Aphanomyces astaci TaxID=112090 RepID=W4GLN2_APHAT|nr:hypothetical protein H257_06118 [Aphanomyces astaci]ETV80585.1 hypothetical protein H257_06118 [Aphanomyces astaci]|eukprot:XP_009829532.1 hypothetical protein H257_06118 [Aphanomyces astaci]